MKVYLAYIFIVLAFTGLNTVTRKFIKLRWKWWIGYGLPALGMMLFMGITSEPHVLFSDFKKAYYPAGSSIIHDPAGLYFQAADGFVNIPIIALLFVPFSSIKRLHAELLFTIIGIVAILITCYLLIKLTKVSGWKRTLILGLFVINGPLYNTFREGNLTHFIILLLIGGLFCLEKKREFWLGAILAIAALIKVPLFLMGIYFLLKRKWQVLAGFSVALLTIVGASILLFGIELHITWLHYCIIPFIGKPLAAFNVQSVSGFLARLLTNNSLINWQPIEVGWNFKILQYILLSLLIGETIWVCWRSKESNTLETENLEFSIFLCLALIMSPISWTHYYSLLLLPLSLYFSNKLAVPTKGPWVSFVMLSILLISPPVTLIESQNLLIRLLVSNYFFGGVLLLEVLLAARLRSSKYSSIV